MKALRLPACLAFFALLLVACDPPPSSDCLYGKDVSDWKPVEVSPEAVTTPVLSCGKTVGFDITMPPGDHASVMWRYEKGVGTLAGEKVAFAVDLESSGPPLFSLRPSIESAARSELGFVEHKTVGMVRAVVPDQTAPTPGAFRVLQVVFPQSGAGKWRVYGFTGW